MTKTTIFAAIDQDPLEPVALEGAARVGDLIDRLAANRPECKEMTAFKEDEDEPLAPDQSLKGQDNLVIRLHRCKAVAVSVHYKAGTFERKFAPAATIGRITKWATRQAGIGAEEAEEHVLQVSGTREQPPRNTHLGTLVGRTCAVAFDLVRKPLVQG